MYSKTGLDFLVLGDWGGSSDSEPSTQDELNNAELMGKVADEYDVDFVLLVGDNFYEHGLWPDVHSKRFQTSFEDVFTAPSLQNISFYVIPGNHDYEGNITAEIEYSKVLPISTLSFIKFFLSQISNRWVFPERYYSLHFAVPHTEYSLDIIMTDTIQLSGPLAENIEDCVATNRTLNECDTQPHRELLTAAHLGYESKNDWSHDNEWQWLRNEISSSNASYLLVAGHYPIYSCAEHGPTYSLVEELKPMLLESNAQLYINGHDHTMEYILEDDHPSIGYVVSGAGKTCTNSTHHADRLPEGSLRYHTCRNGGFVRIHVEDTVQVFYYLGDANGTIDWSSPPIQPRLNLTVSTK